MNKLYILFISLFFVNIATQESIYVVTHKCEKIGDSEPKRTVEYTVYEKFPVYSDEVECVDSKEYVACDDNVLNFYTVSGNGGECGIYLTKEKSEGCVEDSTTEFSYCTDEVEELNDGECHSIYYEDEECQDLISENVFTMGEETAIDPYYGFLYLYDDYVLIRFSHINYDRYAHKYNGPDFCFKPSPDSTRYMKLQCNYRLKIYEYEITQHYHDSEGKNTSTITATTRFSCLDGGDGELNENNFECIRLEHSGKYFQVRTRYNEPYCAGEPIFEDFYEVEPKDDEIRNNYRTYCSDTLPIIPGGVFTLLYRKEESCNEIVNFNAALLQNRVEDVCEIQYRHPLSNMNTAYVSKTHFHYEVVSGGVVDCEPFIEGENEFFSCLYLEEYPLFGPLYTRTTFLIDEIPNLLNETNCDHKKCVLTGEFFLPSIHVNVELDASNTRMIIDLENLPDVESAADDDESYIYVDKEGEVDVEGVVVVVNLESVERYEEIKELVETNDGYSMTLVKGKYKGKMGDNELRVPDSIEECEMLSSNIVEDKDRIMLGFSIDSTGCSNSKGVKWWIPLLIVEGIIAVGIIVFVILVLKVEKVRSLFLPYRQT